MSANFEFNASEALAEADAQFDGYRQEHVELLGEALVMLAESAMAYAKEFTVPVYTGYLRSTGWVDPNASYGAQSIEVTLGFSADYALEQELAGNNPGYRKDRPLAGRRFMRRAMLYTLADAERRIAVFMASRSHRLG